MVQFYSTNGYGNNLYIDDINITGVVGIAEGASLDGFSIYPNPANNYIVIEGKTDSEKIHYAIVNVIGGEIKSGDIFSNGNSLNEKISVSGLRGGVYFLQLHDGKNTSAKKIVVQ